MQPIHSPSLVVLFDTPSTYFRMSSLWFARMLQSSDQSLVPCSTVHDILLPLLPMSSHMVLSLFSLLCRFVHNGLLSSRTCFFSPSPLFADYQSLSTIIISFFTLSCINMSGLLYFTCILVAIRVSTLISTLLFAIHSCSTHNNIIEEC